MQVVGVVATVGGMRFGFVVPHEDARQFAEVAALGERSGWDGVFTWEAVFGVDAWVALGAAAMVTERIRLGTMLTPVSRWKPWDLASRVGTVDRLSDGRVILGAGLGALHEGWTAFEADEGRRARAEKLDECLAIYDGLLRGQPYRFEGRHYTARPTDFMLPDPPVQQPHPPVWLVGAQVVGRRRQPSLDRAARWDGWIPQVIEGESTGKPTTLEEFAAMVADMRSRRLAAGLELPGTTSYSRRTAQESSSNASPQPRVPGPTPEPPGGSRAGGHWSAARRAAVSCDDGWRPVRRRARASRRTPSACA